MARDKKTEPVDDKAGELPELTDQQLKFVMALEDGLNQTDAYKLAYDASGMGINTIYVAASRVANNPKVAAWRQYFKEQMVTARKRSIYERIANMERLREQARQTGNLGASVKAEELAGKLEGHYVDRTEDVSKSDPLDIIKSLAGFADAEGNINLKNLAQCLGVDPAKLAG